MGPPPTGPINCVVCEAGALLPSVPYGYLALRYSVQTLAENHHEQIEILSRRFSHARLTSHILVPMAPINLDGDGQF